MKDKRKISNIALIFTLIMMFFFANLAYALRVPLITGKIDTEKNLYNRDKEYLEYSRKLKAVLVKMKEFVSHVDANKGQVRDYELAKDTVGAISDAVSILENIEQGSGGEMVGHIWNESWKLPRDVVEISKNEDPDKWKQTKDNFNKVISGIAAWLESQGKKDFKLPEHLKKDNSVNRSL